MTCQETVQLIIPPRRRGISERFVIVPCLIKVKVIFRSSTRPPSLAAQIVFSVGETRCGAVHNTGFQSGQTRIDVALGKCIDVLLRGLVGSLEVMADVLKGLAELRVVHVGRLKDVESHRVAL